MTFQPNPRQALLLWRMITGETPEEREPMLSKAKPDLSSAEKQALIKAGFIESEQREGKARRAANFLVLTDRAWAWAGSCSDHTLARSQESTAALQALLHRLIPFLKRRGFALAELFAESSPDEEETLPAATPPAEASLDARILAVAEVLIGGRRAVPIRLTALRAELKDVPRDALDRALRRLHDRRRIVLSRDDNTAQVTELDRVAALTMGDAARHLFYLED
jgi:hypothetical protein